jgi:hypothetical protein
MIDLCTGPEKNQISPLWGVRGAISAGQSALADPDLATALAGQSALADPATGLVHLGNGRWYDPALGRPLQPNPLGGPPTVPQALNRYAATSLGPPG